jgi:hypothetical protein
MSTLDNDPREDIAEEVDVEAVDVDDTIRRSRLKSLFDARDNCRLIREKAQTVAATENKSRVAANSHYRHAIETYVREVEPLFAQTESGRQYWRAYDFGEITLSPDVEVRSPRRDDHDIYVLAETGQKLMQDLPEQVMKVRGLNTLFELDSPMCATFELAVSSRAFGKNSTMRTQTVRRQVPFKILDRMYATVNGYLAEIGIGVSVDMNDSTATADYTDIV